jgi:hypothetical protein
MNPGRLTASGGADGCGKEETRGVDMGVAAPIVANSRR